MPRYKTALAEPGTGTLPRRYDQLGWRTPQASFACSTILVGSLDPLVAVLRLTKNLLVSALGQADQSAPVHASQEYSVKTRM